MSLPFIEKLFNSVEQRTNITTGQEYETGRIIDGKKEYGKRINCGAGPNNNIKTVSHGLTNVIFTKIEGIAQSGETAFPVNNTRPMSGTDSASIGVYLSSGSTIAIVSKTDRSNYTVYVDLYYIKN